MMKKLLICLCGLSLTFVLSSCSAPKNVRNSYCTALKNSQFVNSTDLKNGNKQTLQAIITEFQELKALAPSNLTSYWDTLITYTDKAVRETNSQTLNAYDINSDKYINAYKKILNDFNENCF